MNIHKLPVHPSADIFPMIPDDELKELAEDIKKNGLIHPIVIKDGKLIDGRNRRAACKLVGVEPELQELNSEDIDAYIIASNINRRHMTKGQRAMAVAKIYPDKEKGGRGKNSKLSFDFTHQYINKARTVLKHLPEMAENVLAGYTSLSNAYEEAQTHIKLNESDTKRLERLKSIAPEMADRVIDGEIELTDAIHEHEAKIEKERTDRIGWWIILKDMDFQTKAFTDESIKRLGDAYKKHGAESEVNLKAMIKKYKNFITKLEKSL